MTENEFNNLLYIYFLDLRSYQDISPVIDELDLLWIAAMRLAMEVDRQAVEEYCDRDKPLQEKYKMQRRQFTAFKKIATRNKNIKDVDIKTLHDQFQAKSRKESR